MTVKGHTDDTDGTDFLWLAALGRRTLATNGTQEIKEIKEIWAAHDNLNDILRRISKKKHRLRDGPALTMF